MALEQRSRLLLRQPHAYAAPGVAELLRVDQPSWRVAALLPRCLLLPPEVPARVGVGAGSVACFMRAVMGWQWHWQWQWCKHGSLLGLQQGGPAPSSSFFGSGSLQVTAATHLRRLHANNHAGRCSCRADWTSTCSQPLLYAPYITRIQTDTKPTSQPPHLASTIFGSSLNVARLLTAERSCCSSSGSPATVSGAAGWEGQACERRCVLALRRDMLAVTCLGGEGCSTRCDADWTAGQQCLLVTAA